LAHEGVPDIDFSSLCNRYRMHLVYPLEAMLVTLAVGGMMDKKSNLELIRRAAVAAQDQDSFRILLDPPV
ncbi:MAG: hypothetical protein ACOC0U_03960, partial [Desulfovibrionales bacterium]